MTDRFESVVQHNETSKTGMVKAMVDEVPVTEKQIQSDRNLIIARLDGCYNNLTDSMSEFQTQWDDDYIHALAVATKEGALSGASDWADGMGDLFDGETWSDMAESIGEFTVEMYDLTADYAANVYEDMQKTTAKIKYVLEHSDETLANPRWVHAQAEELGREITKTIEDAVDKSSEMIGSAVAGVKDAFKDAQLLYKHRQKIMDLPMQIGLGEVDKVEFFVDTVVKDLDESLYNDIKCNPDYYASLELIKDHDTALTYMAYFSLAIDAIPPNFYAYSAAKGAAYVVLELILMVILALLSAGTAVAARIAMIVARFSAMAAKTSKTLKKAQQAISAFIRVIEDFIKAAKESIELGKKLMIARSPGTKAAASTTAKMTARRAKIKRERGRCRICHETTHKTPSYQLGTIQYE